MERYKFYCLILNTFPSLLINNPTRVKDIFGIKELFEPFHDVDFVLSTRQMQVGFFIESDTVFCRN